jgi:hypothetical protein
MCALKLIKEVIYPWQRILFFCYHLVQLPEYDTKSQCTILILHGKKIGNTNATHLGVYTPSSKSLQVSYATPSIMAYSFYKESWI